MSIYFKGARTINAFAWRCLSVLLLGSVLLTGCVSDGNSGQGGDDPTAGTLHHTADHGGGNSGKKSDSDDDDSGKKGSPHDTPPGHNKDDDGTTDDGTTDDGTTDDGTTDDGTTDDGTTDDGTTDDGTTDDGTTDDGTTDDGTTDDGTTDDSTTDDSTTDDGADTGTGADVTLAWVAPTTRDDGEPISLSAIGHYEIHLGQETGSYDQVVRVDDPSATEWVLPGLEPGSYYVAMLVEDVDGLQSDYSEEIQFTIGE